LIKFSTMLKKITV